MTDNLPGLRRSGMNVISMWSQRIVGILVMLVTTPIITRHFGLELMGVWLLVTQYVQHMTLLELGLNTSLTRFLARHRASGDVKAASCYLSASVFTLLVIGSLVVLTAPFLAQGFQSVFKLPPGIDTQVYWLVLLASLTVGLNLPLRTGVGMLSSRHHFNRLAMWETLVLVTRLILVLVCFLLFEPSLLVLGLISFAPTLLGNLMLFRDGRRANPDLVIKRNLVLRQDLIAMFSVSGAAVVITLSAVLVRQSSPMLVGFQLGVELVAVLAFPILIVSAVMPFVGVANRLIGPVASQLAACGKQEALYKVGTIACKYVLSLGFLSLAGFYYLGHPLLDLWLGGPKVDDKALHLMANILVIIFSGFVLAIPGFILREILMVVGKHWHAAGAEVLGSMLGVAVGFGLMIETQLGVMGMAIGIWLAFVIRGAGFLMTRGAAYFSVPYLRLMADCAGRPLGIAGLMIFASETFSNHVLQDANVWLLGSVSFGTAVVIWFVGVWSWVIDPDHKKKLTTWLRSRMMMSNR